MAFQFTAAAHPLVRLDVGAGRHFLQEDFDRFFALDAFKGQYAGGFRHGNDPDVKNAHFIIGLRLCSQLLACRGVNRSAPEEQPWRRPPGEVIETGSNMNKDKQPSKESVRQWLRAQIAQRRPPPDAHEIRRELGWELSKVRLAKTKR